MKTRTVSNITEYSIRTAFFDIILACMTVKIIKLELILTIEILTIVLFGALEMKDLNIVLLKWTFKF